ncbi:hypothetical protein D9619_011325 [Psilocybe cf. subviscida]|uniref:P-loop containing nucleoside triphosphate hydrolase protein n=1 Tax=Psilocybe cf. subviscida TaxID=2480587 RepID=A0A8H5BJ15_9AGAR|nr:hypothetical protein D9619_011325 [Psilocybe cf. subviscida]
MDMEIWDSGHIIASFQPLSRHVEWIVQNTLVIPPILAAFFTLVPISYAIMTAFHSRPSSTTNADDNARSKSLADAVAHHGGWTRFLLMLFRLLGCLALVSVSAFSLPSCFVSEDARTDKIYRCPNAWLTFTYIYSSVLGVASLSTTAWASHAVWYNNALLFATFAVFAYRDLWPLATYTLSPQDAGEGPILWFKISTLFIIAVVVPLCTPRKYVPVDPKDPMAELNTELTCSLLERMFFSYLDTVVRVAARVSHLTPGQMPPLVDRDYSANLEKKSFAHLDPLAQSKQRHVFFGWLRVFRKEFFIMALSLVGVGVSAFFVPTAIYRILSYLENGPGQDFVRPWFWVVFLFTGALARSLFYYTYILHGNTITVQSESLLTQLIFQHSLRIRATAGDGSDTKESPQAAQPSDPPADSSAETEPLEGDATTGSESGQTKPLGSQSELSEKQKNLYGKIVNLVTRDVNTIGFAKEVMFLVVEVPLQLTLSIVFLYQILGWSSLVGLAATIVLLPVPGYATKLLHNIQEKQMELSDARVQKVTEVLSVIRMVKLFGWQARMATDIKQARKSELSAIFRFKVLDLCIGVVNHFIPSFTMVVTYATYTGIMKQQLTPSVIFASLTVFDRLRSQLWNIQNFIGNATRGKVSFDRLNDFLTNTELLDAYTSSTDILSRDTSPLVSNDPTLPIGFKKVTFTWSLSGADLSKSRSRRMFRLQVPDELIFKPNCINLITGPTGSGKTAVLMALLGEMHYVPHGPDSWANLPRDVGIAYAAQESWVQNETIRQNILFNKPYDEARYKKVIHQCALTADLELFDAGDQTEVGEKGVTLSGGQKARVTLARAIYSSAQILLLDDILAALDVHTAKWIVDNCLKGELVKGRTVLLVTHNIGLALPIAQQVVSIDASGMITVQDGSKVDTSLLPEILDIEDVPGTTEKGEESTQSDAVAGDTTNGKLVVAEEIAEGRVSWRAIKLFLSSVAGGYPSVFFVVSIFGFIMSEVFFVSQKWFLGFWGSQYETHDPSEVSVPFYLAVYSGIVLAAVLIDTASNTFYAFGSMRASKRINELLIKSVLGSTLRWLDETPVSRIIARCTNDMGTVDSLLADGVSTLGIMTIALLTEMGIVILFAPLFVFPVLVIAAIGIYVGNLYVKAQLSAQREKSNAKAPVIAHVTASIAGIVSIRAYGAEAFLKAQAHTRIDRHSQTTRLMNGLFRWLGVRIDLLGNLYLTGVACYLVYGPHIGASNTGFTLNVATDFSMLLLSWLTFFNNLGIQANSLERIQSFLDIDHEPLSQPSGIPPAAWPTSGDLRVEGLSARYSKNGPKVLHDISFHVKSGERIGIVGRTGSGKSSLTLSLLRGIITEGTVLFDGRRTDELNLDVLRANITIIPQTPELMSGTLRKNLDPFDQYDDSTLNNALKDVGLYSLQEELGEKKLTLDSDISAGGANVSVGERQIIALARALIRHSRILILDEDYRTDASIQETLRHRLPADVTVLTIAHRLQSIMDADKIMVLEAGRIVEYDSPSSLLAKSDSKFKALVDGSGDKDALYERTTGSQQ